mmetsp:Transcript_16202/g.51724  ORF Transcript_16202/g.51724 Transcript_16202/m.51724 type:complete len:287 (+) Transcript_16202:14-874(+)
MLCLIQPRLAAAAPRAPPLNAEALYTGLPPASGLYAPFVHRTFELLDEAAIPLAPYPSPADLQLLRSGDGHGGAAPALLSVRAFSSERLRHGRLLLLDGGPSLQVLNLCFFPRLDSALPTLSADLVTLPGGSLVAIDWQPNGPARPHCAEAEAQLDTAYAKHRRRLPPGGPVPPDSARFFSDRFLWSRLPASTPPDELVSLLLPAMEDYTRAYLRLLVDPPPPSPPPASELDAVLAAQLEYATYRTERDPARPMLSRLFGEEAAGRLLRESLFDLPLRLARGEQAH